MRHLIALLIVVACTSCTQQKIASKPQIENTGPVIVRIVSRDSTITARAGGKGAVYSMNNNQGEQLIPSMTLDQLQAQRPELANRVKTMRADASIGAWAGLGE